MKAHKLCFTLTELTGTTPPIRRAPGFVAWSSPLSLKWVLLFFETASRSAWK